MESRKRQPNRKYSNEYELTGKGSKVSKSTEKNKKESEKSEVVNKEPAISPPVAPDGKIFFGYFSNVKRKKQALNK